MRFLSKYSIGSALNPAFIPYLCYLIANLKQPDPL